jgi:hypothetical protein
VTHHVTDHLTFGLRETKVKVHIVQKSRKSRKNVPWDKSSQSLKIHLRKYSHAFFQTAKFWGKI